MSRQEGTECVSSVKNGTSIVQGNYIWLSNGNMLESRSESITLKERGEVANQARR